MESQKNESVAQLEAGQIVGEIIDGLTGLHNRRWLNDTLPRLISRSQRGSKPLSVIVLDIDHFKKFNDTYGHSAGDEVIRNVSNAIVSNLRPTDLGARYGGEEFVVILADTNLTGARIAAERLRHSISVNTVETSDGNVLPAVTISAGIAEVTPSDDAGSLIERADTALYSAKENGRNRVECAEQK